MTVSVVRVGPQDADRLGRFFAGVEKEFALDTTSADWRWRMQENPANGGGPAAAWLCESDGEVVGYLGAIPVSLHTSGRPLKAGWTVDLVVSPAWRSRGVPLFLYRSWMATVDAGLALGGTPGSLAFLTGSGWKLAGHMPCWRRLLRPEAYLREKGGAALALLGRPFSALLAPRAGERTGQLSQGLLWHRELEGLWQRIAPEMGLAVCRDQAYVTWRYLNRPGMTYDLVALHVQGRLEGVAVLRQRLQRGRRIGLVVDLWGSREHLPALVDHAVHRLWSQGSDAVHVFATHGALGRVLKAARFRPKPTTVALLYKSSLDLGAHSPEDPASWWVTLGDSDRERL